MKNKKLYLSIIAAMILAVTAVYTSGPVYSTESSAVLIADSLIDTNSAKSYTCPMHPEVISDKPGECPKCGMDLILKEEGKKDEKKDQGHNHKGHKGCMGH